jgi:hypothetical protein
MTSVHEPDNPTKSHEQVKYERTQRLRAELEKEFDSRGWLSSDIADGDALTAMAKAAKHDKKIRSLVIRLGELPDFLRATHRLESNRLQSFLEQEIPRSKI